MRKSRALKRGRLAAAGLLVFSVTAAACGSSGPSGAGGAAGAAGDGSKAVVWTLSGSLEDVYTDSVERFNEQTDGPGAEVQFFQNDPYKQKLRVAMGADNPPDVFYNWAGGSLRSYVDAGAVLDLTQELESDPEWASQFIPSVVEQATFDGKVYGLPMKGMQPELFYYNKDLFEQAGVEVPTTWQELLDTIPKFKEIGVAPISVGGQGKWPTLLYLQFLADRIGGPEVMDRIVAGEKDAWSDPAILQSIQMIQDLVEAGGFVDGFSSVSFDTGQSAALVYTGEAAMELMGSWQYFNFKTNAPEFVEQGKLGWFPFPAVEGGKGDPRNVAGNPSSWYSVSANGAQTEEAVSYLKETLTSDAYIEDMVNSGEVPAVVGVEERLAQSEDKDWLTFVYDLATEAPNFELSWDQLLAPDVAAELLTQIDRAALLEITPQQFADAMNAAQGL